MIRVYKPNSVSPERSRGWQLFIFSRNYFRDPAVYPKEFKANNLVPRKYSGDLLLDLAPSGVCPAFNITIEAVGSYPAFSPLPAEGGLSPQSTGSIFSVALSVYRKNQHPGSYPALRSAEFGLSSSGICRRQLLNTNH